MDESGSREWSERARVFLCEGDRFARDIESEAGEFRKSNLLFQCLEYREDDIAATGTDIDDREGLFLCAFQRSVIRYVFGDVFNSRLDQDFRFRSRDECRSIYEKIEPVEFSVSGDERDRLMVDPSSYEGE